MNKKSYFFIFMFSFLTHASQGFDNELTFSIGMTNVSYAETESALEGENKKDPATGAISAMSGNIHYKFLSQEKKSYYISGTFPLIGGDGSSYFGVHGGVEFYLNELGSRLGLENYGSTIKFAPKLTYYWGLETGVSYLVYLTETAKKTDILFDIGGTGGGHYAITDKIILKGQLAVLKGTGVNTNSFTIKILFGGTYYLD